MSLVIDKKYICLTKLPDTVLISYQFEANKFLIFSDNTLSCSDCRRGNTTESVKSLLNTTV